MCQLGEAALDALIEVVGDAVVNIGAGDAGSWKVHVRREKGVIAIVIAKVEVMMMMKLVPQDHFNTYLGPGNTLSDLEHPFVVHFPGRGDKWTLVERFVGQRRNVIAK